MRPLRKRDAAEPGGGVVGAAELGERQAFRVHEPVEEVRGGEPLGEAGRGGGRGVERAELEELGDEVEASRGRELGLGLAGEELAIVTDIPGTTRDAIRQAIDLDGVPTYFVDTAGWRTTTDPVERIGVERSWGAIEGADVVVFLTDSATGESDGLRSAGTQR